MFKIDVIFDIIVDIIAVNETRIHKKTSLTSNVNSNNSYFESTPKESTAGGKMLLYIQSLVL